jgi:4-amino-4-deoxy-L-arabinose transferase-like glycosyltransferase
MKRRANEILHRTGILCYVPMMKKQKKTDSQSFFDDGNRPLLIVLAVSIILRIIILTEWNASVFNVAVWSDASTYNQWARRIITSGDWIGNQPFLMTPLYPYVLAVLYTITGESLNVVRLFQHAVGIGTIVLLYRSAELVSNRRAAFAAALIAACYGPLMLFANLLLVETLKVFFLVLAFYCLLIAHERNDLRWWIGAGLSIGGAVLCRASDLLLLIVVIGWIVAFSAAPMHSRIRSAAVVALSAIILILPVTVRNYAVGKEFIPITSNGGLNFYLGNNPKAAGVYYNVDGLDLANDPDGRVFLESTTGRSFTPGEASAYWMNESKNYIAGDPGGFIMLLGKKFLLFFHSKEIGQLGYNYHFISNGYVPLLGYLLTFSALFPLSIIGIASKRREWKNYLLLFGFLAVQILAVVLFFVTDRFRISSIPFFILFAGIGIDWLLEQWKLRRRGTLLRAAALSAAAIMITGPINFRIDEEYSMEHEYIGLNYFDMKFYENALAEFRQALRYKESFHIRNNIGNVYAASGNIPAAMHEYKRGIELHPRQAISVFSMGTAYVRMQQFDSALVCFAEAKRINPRFAPAYLNAGLAQWFLGNYIDAERELERYLELETDDEKTVTVRRDLARLKELIAEEKK